MSVSNGLECRANGRSPDSHRASHRQHEQAEAVEISGSQLEVEGSPQFLRKEVDVAIIGKLV